MLFMAGAMATNVPRRTFHGIIVAVSPSSITVQGSNVRLVFQVDSDTEIVVDGDPNADTSDLNVRDYAGIAYTEEKGVHVAHRIEVMPSTET